MSKVYFVRHQAAGILTDFPFSAPPSDKQLEAIARLCFQRHGATHPKGDAAYWTRVVELEMLGPNEVPEVPERDLTVANSAEVGQAKVEAKGEVTPP